MGSLISTTFLSADSSLSVGPPVLSHARVPQEAALHEGQRSGKEGRPLTLSFATTLANAHLLSPWLSNNNNSNCAM